MLADLHDILGNQRLTNITWQAPVRPVCVSVSFVLPLRSRFTTPGRNGGHLTPHAFLHYSSLAARYGAEEGKRSLEIERYTAAEIRTILKEHGQLDSVDFVSGGRVVLFFTAQEQESAREDYEAAKAAGIDVTDAQWLSKEEVEQVCLSRDLFCSCAHSLFHRGTGRVIQVY